MPTQNSGKGTLFLLGEETEKYIAPSFLVLPYSEPAVSKPVPRYYPLISETVISTMEFTGEQKMVAIRQHTTKEDYITNVKALKEQIQAGNIYEINYCIKFSAAGAIDPLRVFQNLCSVSQAPYPMLARLGNEYVLCASPELYLQKSGYTLITKPIKGTIGRSKKKDEDERLKKTLQESHKDRTENVMAVDVARNDLSILATRGSVKVDRLYDMESFTTVHQMVSTVRCELPSDTGFSEIIAATFPMASMTGAPKTRAMELIRKTENFKRQFYSGTMGFVQKNGDFTLPVLIRSIFYNALSGVTTFAAGGAITYLSDANEEYEECLLKASGMIRALNGILKE